MQAFYFFIYLFEAFVAYLYFSDNYKEKTKNDKKYHGYGTKSIEKTAEKYNGICQWNYDKKEFHYNILFNK